MLTCLYGSQKKSVRDRVGPLEPIKERRYLASSAFIASSTGAPFATRFATIPSFVVGV